MSVSVSFYSFSKVRNSTKRPAVAGVTYSCLLKENCDKWNPVFVLSGDPSTYNYCSAWGNYYYIDGIEYVPPYWHIQCTLDPMATWRTQIGAASLYVTRANNLTARNEDLIDKLPTKVGLSGNSLSTIDIENNLFQNQTPSYVVTMVAGTSSTGCDHWVFTESMYKLFVHKFMDTSGWDFSAALADLNKGAVDPITYIKDVRWYPFTPNHSLNEAEIVINNWPTGAYGWTLTDGTIFSVSNTSITVPPHPQAASYGNFLNSNQYTTYTWADPIFGTIDIDANITANAPDLEYRILVDPSCGSAHMRLWAKSSAVAYIIAERDAEMGIPVVFSAYNRGFQSMASNLGGAIGNIATLNIGGAVENLFGIANSVMHPKMQTTGAFGSRAMYKTSIVLYCEFVQVEPLDPVTMGYPVCKTMTISALQGGFIQVAKGDVAVAGPSWAAEQIKATMEGGFYYE